MIQNHYRFESNVVETETYCKFYVSISFVVGKTAQAKVEYHSGILFFFLTVTLINSA